MKTIDALRHELPARAAQMNEAIAVALDRLRFARKIGEHTSGDAGEGWKKGLDDALKIMRDCQEAHEAFERWVVAMMAMEEGMTPAERRALLEALDV